MRLPGAGFFAGQSRYAAHPDPANHALNLIAVVLALNGPFYPAYVIALTGRVGLGALLTMLASPFFYAVPWVGRNHAFAGRLALPVVGLVNTLACVKLFGPASGVGLFFIPCILLPAFLFRPSEAGVKWLLIGAATLPFWLPAWVYGPPILHLPGWALARLASLNTLSVAGLCGFIALRVAAALAR